MGWGWILFSRLSCVRRVTEDLCGEAVILFKGREVDLKLLSSLGVLSVLGGHGKVISLSADSDVWICWARYIVGK